MKHVLVCKACGKELKIVIDFYRWEPYTEACACGSFENGFIDKAEWFDVYDNNSIVIDNDGHKVISNAHGVGLAVVDRWNNFIGSIPTDRVLTIEEIREYGLKAVKVFEMYLDE